MSKAWLGISIGLGIIVFGVWFGGRAVMGKFLERHGMAPRAKQTATSAWPATDAGTLARGWVEAFNAGEPQMRAFLAANLAPESLAERDVDTRITTYRSNRERFQTLRVTAIGNSTADVLDTTLTAGDGSKHEFTFETKARKLVVVKRREQHRQHH